MASGQWLPVGHIHVPERCGRRGPCNVEMGGGGAEWLPVPFASNGNVFDMFSARRSFELDRAR